MSNVPATSEMKYHAAIQNAFDIALETDPNVVLLGLGVPDPKGIFGTTLGLQQKYGVHRVKDMPVSENAMTGIAIGAALNGLRPVLMHQRLDFALLSMEQIVNQAAKWNYLFAGQTPVPLVIRLIVGRGWGQGPQHSQSLHSWFAHVPGLKVVLPATPADAKGMMLSAIADPNPVLFIEHRWLHHVHGNVPAGDVRVPLGKPNCLRTGNDLTILSLSHMTIESLKAAEILSQAGVETELFDLRTLSPLNLESVFESVRKTGRLLIADIGSASFGAAGEISAQVVEHCFEALKKPPVRIALPDLPIPTASSLASPMYPGYSEIVTASCKLLDRPHIAIPERPKPYGIPDPSFTGPF